MFSLADIDFQIDVLKGAAADLEARSEEFPSGGDIWMMCRGNAMGLRAAVLQLEQMIERAIEAEAREAMKR